MTSNPEFHVISFVEPFWISPCPRTSFRKNIAFGRSTVKRLCSLEIKFTHNTCQPFAGRKVFQTLPNSYGIFLLPSTNVGKTDFRNLFLLILNPSFFISPLRYFPFIADRMMTEMIMFSRLQQEFSGFPLSELSGKFISIKMNPPLFQIKLDSFEKK